MIVKVFARGGGGGSGVCDYLCGKEDEKAKKAAEEAEAAKVREVTREGARLLAGDIELTRELIDSTDYARAYTAGVLSFEEQADAVPEATKREIMARFEEALLPGLEGNQYNILWVEHTDKGGRLEMNWVVPNVELTTGRRLQPYFDRVDRPRINDFKNIANYEYGLTDPEAPEKRRTLVTAKDLPRERKAAAEAITRGLEGLIASGAVQDRDGVINALEEAGMTITRKSVSSISIADPNGGKNLRLKGAIYEQDFRASKELGKEFARSVDDYRDRAGERYRKTQKNFAERLERAAKRNQELYTRSSKDHAQGIDDQRADHRSSTMADRHGRLGLVSDAGKKDRADVANSIGAGRKGGQIGHQALHLGQRHQAAMRTGGERVQRAVLGRQKNAVCDTAGTIGAKNDRDRTAIAERLRGLGKQSESDRNGNAKRIRGLSEEGATSGERKSAIDRAAGAISKCSQQIERISQIVRQAVMRAQNQQSRGRGGFDRGDDGGMER